MAVERRHFLPQPDIKVRQTPSSRFLRGVTALADAYVTLRFQSPVPLRVVDVFDSSRITIQKLGERVGVVFTTHSSK